MLFQRNPVGGFCEVRKGNGSDGPAVSTPLPQPGPTPAYAKAIDMVVSPVINRFRERTKVEGFGCMISCSGPGYMLHVMATWGGKTHMAFFGKDDHGGFHVGKG